MDRSLAAAILGAVITSQIFTAGAMSQKSTDLQLASVSESASSKPSVLPAVPRGKSTIVGGEVQSVDPVRDELRLKVFGQRSMTILFDERTQVYLDGKRIPLQNLRSTDHGSVQTVLDGTNVFALSIHLLSRSPRGEYQGRVLSYAPDTRELSVSAVLSRDPIKLFVPINISIVHASQPELSSVHSESSDLLKGTLISLTFESDRKGRGIATSIMVMASPGSAVVLSGNLFSLDMHSGSLVLVDPRDEKSYQILFDPARLPISHTLREGDYVMVTATFDDSHYLASTITVD